MRKLAIPAVAALTGLLAAVVAINLFSGESAPSVGADLSGDQADSVNFFLPGALAPDSADPGFDVVFCGVRSNSEPYLLDVAVSNPPLPSDPEDPESPPLPGHDEAGWLSVLLQGGGGNTFNVATNDSFSFGLTLGGAAGVDQLVQLWPKQAGDASGAGAGFSGFASVRAQRGARDPFNGDGRNDNFCLSLGLAAGEGPPGDFRPAEFTDGQISTTLPVPDEWVQDCDGSNGGVLVHPGGFNPPCAQ